MAITTEQFEKGTTVGATTADAQRVRDIANARGMRLYRVISLLLIAWDMLTEEQQHEAHKRLFARRHRAAVATA